MRERREEDSPCWPSRDPLDAALGAPVRGMVMSACGGPSRILSRRDAIPSVSSLPSSPSSHTSSSGESSSCSPFAWTSLDMSPMLDARDSSSFHFSFPSPLRTSAFPRTHAACHDRRHPPSLEASRIERRSIPALAKISLKKDRRKSRIKAISRKRTYQVNRPLIRPHREAVDMLRLKVACNGRPDPSCTLFVCRGFIGHPASLEILGQNTGTHLIHPQRARHQWENPPVMDS